MWDINLWRLAWFMLLMVKFAHWKACSCLLQSVFHESWGNPLEMKDSCGLDEYMVTSQLYMHIAKVFNVKFIFNKENLKLKSTSLAFLLTESWIIQRKRGFFCWKNLTGRAWRRGFGMNPRSYGGLHFLE